MTRDYYSAEQHGLQWVVYLNFKGTLGNRMCSEDSRWSTQKEADEHCRILNKNLTDMYDKRDIERAAQPPPIQPQKRKQSLLSKLFNL